MCVVSYRQTFSFLPALPSIIKRTGSVNSSNETTYETIGALMIFLSDV